jgi:hypothetical protein
MSIRQRRLHLSGALRTFVVLGPAFWTTEKETSRCGASTLRGFRTTPEALGGRNQSSTIPTSCFTKAPRLSRNEKEGLRFVILVLAILSQYAFRARATRDGEVGKWLRSVVQGWLGYHAVPGNTYRLY